MKKLDYWILLMKSKLQSRFAYFFNSCIRDIFILTWVAFPPALESLLVSCSFSVTFSGECHKFEKHIAMFRPEQQRGFYSFFQLCFFSFPNKSNRLPEFFAFYLGRYNFLFAINQIACLNFCFYLGRYKFLFARINSVFSCNASISIFIFSYNQLGTINFVHLPAFWAGLVNWF